MATVSKQPIGVSTTTVTMTAATSGGGDFINSPEGGVLFIRNGSGVSVTCTIVAPGNLPNGDPYPDKAVTIPATSDRFIKLGPEYTDGNGQANIQWSAITTVTFAVLAL